MGYSDSAHYFWAAALAACSLTPMTSVAATSEPAPGGLRRGADWGFRLAPAPDGQGAEVRSLKPGSAAARAGLKDGDRVLRIGETALTDRGVIAATRRRFRGGDRVELEVARGDQRRTTAFSVPALPLETIEGCRVEYGSVVTSRGYRVRTILSRPAQAQGPLPTILFIPWLSCDAVESPTGPGDGWNQTLRGLAQRNGWNVVRVEKPGVGDSEGPDCATNDCETDLDAFRAALRQLLTHALVDTSRIVLFGGSIGGALAPRLALEQPVAGLIIAGTFSRTWFEHMLEIERQRLTLDGRPPAEVNQAIAGFAEFYALYLGERLTPGEVIARRPDLKPLWYDAPDGQYGRPAAYYHQVARLNVEEAWGRLEVPVLVLYGEYDWIMSRAEHEHIRDLVNARRPGLATLEVLPRTDHNLQVYASPADAFRFQGGRFDASVIGRVSSWLDSTFGTGAH